ncbi:hypothetical protein FAM09_03400 [Niastella caeni]|uniref:Uncharacterized protein n=1 Tax=Niastella caeni TaxID=2569763 RepID=A0A4S8I432_9BACT|nr:YbaY family lipoprotein [Niastella caeni]THU41172.1 hypothetical protein FAM09_03400 [Niastella caeni]
MNSTLPHIEGQLIFRQTVPAFHNATVHVYLEDVSYADTTATALAHVIIPGVSHSKEETVIAFRLELKSNITINSTADYSIRVWVNKNNDGVLHSHDLFSDTRCPVLTHGYGNQVDILFH